jgi:hypothetical protein
VHLVASVPEQVRSRGLAIGINVSGGSFPGPYVYSRTPRLHRQPTPRIGTAGSSAAALRSCVRCRQRHPHPRVVRCLFFPTLSTRRIRNHSQRSSRSVPRVGEVPRRHYHAPRWRSCWSARLTTSPPTTSLGRPRGLAVEGGPAALLRGSAPSISRPRTSRCPTLYLR